MSRPKQRQIVDRRENDFDGHVVMWELTMEDLFLLKSWPFRKTYQTHCEVAPTKWKFELSLPEIRDDGTCSLKVILERLDTIVIELEAYVSIDILDPDGGIIFPEQYFSWPEVIPGESMQDIVELTPLPGTTDAINRKVIILIDFIINFCHADSK